jgi:serine/threonine protein kinase/formylglycine-generating enzyme required for sulfatase activity
MEIPNSLHPADQTLSSYGLGKLDEVAAGLVNDHLEGCADCRQRMAGFTSDSFLGRLREAQKRSASPSSGGSLDAGTLSYMQAGASSSPPSADTLPPGLADHADYEIKRELGRGGMGVVYLAHNSMMGRDEVLKVLGRHVIDRPNVLERFQREIRAVARLRHPNIVAAYSAFRIEGGIVFAMEYVEGLDLSRMVKSRGPLSVTHAAYFVHQAAIGLQHAHERGMVHRDIKPHNLMLTSDGKARVVKVLDFGLAKASREQKVDVGLTSEGQALGTPDYIAPEQILNAQSADIRADLYSLGGTLFYLLTGRPPFQANSLYDIYQAHISRDAEPLNLIRPEVPAELAALVAKLMAKEPSCRFQTPGEVAEALKPYFKKTAGTSRSEFSVPGQPGPQRGATAIEPLPIKRPANSGGQALKPKSPEATSQAEGLWEGLIDTREADQTGSPESPLTRNYVPRRPERPRWVLPSTAAGLTLIAFLVAWGFIIKIKSKDGEVVLSDPPSGTIVTVDSGKVNIVTGGNDRVNVPATQSPVSKLGKTPPSHHASTARIAALAAALEKQIPMHYVNDTPIDDVLRDVKKASKEPNGSSIQIYVDPLGLMKAEKTMASTISINLEGVPLKTTLRLALKRLGLDYCAKEGLLFISDAKSVQEEINRVASVPNDAEPATKAVLAALEKTIPMRYPYSTVIFDVINDVKKALAMSGGAAIPIDVDPFGLEKAGKTLASTISINLEDIPLRITLNLLLRQIGMDYYVKEGILTISDRETITLVFGGARTKVLDRPPTMIRPAEPDSPEVESPIQRSLRANLIGVKLATIPSGEFNMGSTPDEYPQRPNPEEFPKHRVRISQPFLLGVTEVTQGQYRAVTGTNPSRFPGRDDYPVENVSWLAAVKFCNGLSALENLPAFFEIHDQDVSVPNPKGPGYRLPTEAEWEYACRARSTLNYNFGNADAALANHAWVGSNSDKRTHTVGGWKPNAFGLFDMHGNVQEWCWDVYDRYSPTFAIDPTGPRSSADRNRVYRNGAFDDSPYYNRSSYRGSANPISADKTIGFRVARNMPTDGSVARTDATRSPARIPTADSLKVSETARAKEKARKTPPPQDAPPGRVLTLAAALEKRISLKYRDGIPLGQFIKDLKQATKGPDDSGIPIYVDPLGLHDAEKTTDSLISIDLEGLPLKQTLRLALNPLGLDYRVGEGVLFIGSMEDFKQGKTVAVDVNSDRTPESDAVLAALEKTIPMKYLNETPLKKVIDDLKTALKRSDGSDVPIYVDRNGLHEAEKTMDSPICIDLEGIPLRVTLRCMLDQIGMGYYVKEGLLTITDQNCPAISRTGSTV